MPLLESWDVEVEVTVRVLERHSPRKVVTFTTTGKSSGNSAKGLPATVAPALTDALADGAIITDNFRKGSRDAR